MEQKETGIEPDRSMQRTLNNYDIYALGLLCREKSNLTSVTTINNEQDHINQTMQTTISNMKRVTSKPIVIGN